jgi:hypothetical protein
MAASPFYTQIHTAKKFRFLTRKTDASGNVYAYGKGVASLAAGDFVVLDSVGLPVRSLAASTGLVGIAMSANTSATNYSWYLVRGTYATANVATHSSGAGKALFLSSTAGRASSTPLTESTAYGAFTTGNSVSNVGPVVLHVETIAPNDIST